MPTSSPDAPPRASRPPGPRAVAVVRDVLLLGVALGLCWLPARLGGGADHVPPLWTLLPVIVAARRFGLAGAIISAVAGGLLSGPLTPADVSKHTHQLPTDWLWRLGFYILLGTLAAVLFKRLKQESAAHREARRESEETAARLDVDVRQRQALEEQLRRLAFRDVLTGLANRALLEGHLAAALARAQRTSSAVALICLDLNDFKLVNDSLGHAAGDELLREVARRLGETVRAGDVLARYGGDEFLVMIPDIPADGGDVGESAGAVAMRVFERIAEALAPPFAHQGAVFHIDASAGVSIYPHDALDADALHRHADAAMYQAKATKAGIAVFDADDRSDALQSLSKSAALRTALACGELELRYQPVIRLADQSIMGVEALIHWRQADGTLLGPASILPAAEQTGLIEELGDFVLTELCEQAVAWQAAHLHPHIGINVSPRQLRRPGIARHFHDELERHELRASQFVIELTESAWTLDRERMTPVLDQLRDSGFSLALDDFGAGYSTLSRLLRLPVDVIKIERAFLAPIPDDGPASAIVTAILQLAEACGCDVVAEGVETAAQLRFLTERGCSLAQGNWFSEPVSSDQMTALLREGLTTERQHAQDESVGVAAPLARGD